MGGWGQPGKNVDPLPNMHNKMGGGPVGGPAASVSKEAIWNSKQFRILCDMGTDIVLFVGGLTTHGL